MFAEMPLDNRTVVKFAAQTAPCWLFPAASFVATVEAI
jgi:hypothetical protein